MEKQPLIVIAGPTAAGKSALAVELALRIGGEIISADSMQVYRGMDIGSAKITKEEARGVPHHLIDVLEPTEEFNVYIFQQMAKRALREIYGNGHIPIVCGGTGFYIQALLYDIDFTGTAEDPAYREELSAIAKARGNAALHRMLEAVDPEAAAEIHENNVKRVIRALEYFRAAGEKISEHNRKERGKESPYAFHYAVLDTDRPALYARIDRRVDQMMEAGFLDEVRVLKARGCTEKMTSMQGLGYRELLSYLGGGYPDLAAAVSAVKQNTRHFSKRQLTWFRRERDVRWMWLPDYAYDPERLADELENELRSEGILRGTFPEIQKG